MIAKVLGYQGIPTTRTVREAKHVLVGQAEALTDEVRAKAETLGWDVVENQYVPDGKLVAIDRAATNPWWTPRRTVVDPVYVVPQTLPCPDPFWHDKLEAAGHGCKLCVDGVVAPPKPDYIATPCPTCGGADPKDYINDPPHTLCPTCDGLMSVVAYKVTAIDELPVRRGLLPRDPTNRTIRHEVVIEQWTGETWAWVDERGFRNVTDEPWAADLTPGRPVWRLHLEALDQPYTEMRCHGCDDAPGRIALDGHEPIHIVPLSVPVGEVAEIELVDPKENTDG